MRSFEWSKEGGSESHVDGFFLIEIKSLFSIVLLRFRQGGREAYHSHAFNAFTFWLKGLAWEFLLNGKDHRWTAGMVKFTPRNCFHRVEAIRDTWALSFRGPWSQMWREYLPESREFVTLTNGRKVVERKGPVEYGGLRCQRYTPVSNSTRETPSMRNVRSSTSERSRAENRLTPLGLLLLNAENS